MKYPNSESTSAALFERAQSVLTDGGSRSTIRIAPYSIYVQSAQGKYVTDVDGNRLIDFNNNYTAMLHGHAHPTIVDAATKQIRRGTGFSFGSEAEYALADLLCGRVGSFDKIRFMNSGSEAVMKAIKAARAYTGRPKIAKCENAYHGSYDFAEVSLGVEPTNLADGDPLSRPYSQGTPQGVLDNVVVIPHDDPETARRILDSHAHDLAAVLVDPIGLGMARIPHTDKFFAMVQDFCESSGALFIADEVVSFRAGLDGIQGARGLTPHLTTLGKIIGGGFPVGAVAGSADVMSVFEAGEGKAKLPHGGTYNANPVSMAAGHAAMSMTNAESFQQLNALGDAFRQGCREVLEQTNTDGSVQGQYSIFSITFGEPELNDDAPRGAVYRSSGMHQYMVQNGYWMSPGMLGICSTVMDLKDVDAFCETLKAGIGAIRDRCSSAA
ncbi:MAG: aspartate aminotransferase family protein [Woeseiaceae bacterium]